MKYLATLHFIFFLLLFTTGSFGQNQQVVTSHSNAQVERDGAMFYVHTVEKGQTIFSICKTYGIENETLVEDNPLLKNGLKLGNILYIRRDKGSIDKAHSNKPKETLSHTVQWYETLKSIAQTYSVSEESIIRLNSMNSAEVQPRQVLLIPLEEKISKSNYNYRKPKEEYNIAVLLPLASKNTESQDYNNFIEFYQGLLLAAQSLKLDGMNIELNVFDTDDYSKIEDITRTKGFANSDLIIGPVFSKDLPIILKYANEKGIAVVSPMDPKSEALVSDNPNLFQVTTPMAIQQKCLLSDLTKYNHIALFSEESMVDKDITNLTKEILDERGLPYSSYSYTVKQSNSAYDKIASKLSTSKINDVIITSNSEAFVYDVLRNLNLLSTRGGYNIRIYGLSRWRSFESVDINYFHAMNLTLSLPYFVDYGEQNVRTFISRYRALYKSEPNAYSFQAYDIGYYFLSMLYKFGPDFMYNIDNSNSKLLQSDYFFVKQNDRSGFINNSSRKVIYKPDFSVETRSSSL